MIFLDNSYSWFTSKFGYLTLKWYWTETEYTTETKYRTESRLRTEFPFAGLGFIIGLVGLAVLVFGVLYKPKQEESGRKDVQG